MNRSPLSCRKDSFAARPHLGITAPLAAAVALLITPTTLTATTRIDATAAVQRAVGVSHAAVAAAALIDAAQAGVEAADAGRRPVLSADASLTQMSSVPEFRAPLNGPGEPLVTIFPDIRTHSSLGLTVRQPLYTGGALTAGLAISRRELDAARADASALRSAVALQARLAYWQAVAASANVNTAAAEVERAQSLVHDTDALREAGMAVRADVLSAEARLAAARLRLVQAHATTANAISSLASLLHLPTGEFELADTMPGSAPAQPPALASLLDEARTSRSDLDAARQRLAAISARAQIAGAAARPTVGAVAQVQEARPNQRYLPLSDTWNESWSVGVAAGWTLWDGGRTKAEVATVRCRRDAATAELAELQRQIDLEVDLARRSLMAALDAVAAARASRLAAAAREEAVRERYAEGMATSAEVVDAQTELATAETEQVAALTGAWTAAALLERAIGR